MRSLLRSELARRLNAHRDNDVYVLAPTESGRAWRLEITDVAYDPDNDVILVHTAQILDDLDDEAATP